MTFLPSSHVSLQLVKFLPLFSFLPTPFHVLPLFGFPWKCRRTYFKERPGNHDEKFRGILPAPRRQLCCHLEGFSRNFTVAFVISFIYSMIYSMNACGTFLICVFRRKLPDIVCRLLSFIPRFISLFLHFIFHF